MNEINKKWHDMDMRSPYLILLSGTRGEKYD